MKKSVKKKEVGTRTILKVKKLLHEADLPEYALSEDLGFDLRAMESVKLAPYEQKTVRTGLAIEIPQGHVGLIRDRVGIVTKMGVHTAAGTFDPSYRGEVSIVLINFGEETVSIEAGMRIAQMIIIPVTKVKIEEVHSLTPTERYDRSFGSTGTKEVLRDLKGLMKDVTD